MRDSRNRYQNAKDIAAIGPEWAKGCDKCSYGIVSSVPLTGATNLYLERLVQVCDGDLTLCTCRAGLLSRQHLKRLYRQTSSEELGTMRHKVNTARENTPAPTIHMDGERVTA